MATREEAARYTAAAGDALTAEKVALQRAERERDEARAEAKHATECYERVCVTVARMHAAALGEVRSPIVGLVGDVAAVRAERDAAVARVEALARAGMLAASALDGLLGDSNLPEDNRPGVLALRALIAALSSHPAPAVYTRERLERALEAAITEAQKWVGLTPDMQDMDECETSVQRAFWAALDAQPAEEEKP